MGIQLGRGDCGGEISEKKNRDFPPRAIQILGGI